MLTTNTIALVKLYLSKEEKNTNCNVFNPLMTALALQDNHNDLTENSVKTNYNKICYTCIVLDQI